MVDFRNPLFGAMSVRLSLSLSVFRLKGTKLRWFCLNSRNHWRYDT